MLVITRGYITKKNAGCSKFGQASAHSKSNLKLSAAFSNGGAMTEPPV